jgi:adenylate cyclase
VFGPTFLLTAAVCEFLYLRYLSKHLKNNTTPRQAFTYIISFTEISFPAIVLFIIIGMAGNKLLVPVNEILNSPPFLLYFILVILSSLHLDKKICAFSGLIAGIQYAAVSIYFKNHFNIEVLFLPNIIAKSILIMVCGMVAGFVSDKIKQALIEAMHAQDKLINKLDHLVKEKTKEIGKQHEELQIKNKEIVDSIHYAKRIQQALLPNEKYIDKHLKKNKN